ncbi:MAG: hypothetical protein QOE70_4979 [Chthoniobacter sp.]|nr:hypothetical protein [Chthoniobacter sp.]
METHWLFPSPLEAYYRSNPSEAAPFKSSSTANYRGHVATWEIADNRLFLVDLVERIRPDADAAPKASTLKGEPLLRKLFPKVIDEKGKVFASWFNGNLRVFGKPKKRTYKHQDDPEGYDVVEYTEITLLELKGGVVTRETSFPRDEYWSKFNIYLEYRRLKPTDIDAISEHVKYLDSQDKRWEEIGSIEPDGPVRTEKDFQVFLIRYWSEPKKIPLTKFEIIKDATTDFADRGWILDDNLRIVEGNRR